jgi:hypothetical protein
MPTALFAACPECGVQVQLGWSMHNHRRMDCRGASAAVVDNAVAFEGGVMHDDDFDNRDHESDVSIRLEPGLQLSISTYLDSLDTAGTVEYEHVLQYSRWGKYVPTFGDLEIFRFLRATYSGTGVSRRQAQEFLDYQHTTGGSAYLLPRKVEKCWLRVEQVCH